MLYSISLNYDIIEISKRKASNSVPTNDQVTTDTLLVDKNCNLSDVEDDLDDLCGELDEENKDDSDPTEQFILEDEDTHDTHQGNS